jgi:glycosyltransferase involved in cell wall biosynthesis
MLQDRDDYGCDRMSGDGFDIQDPHAPRRVLQLVQRPQRRGAEVFAYDLNRQLESLGLSVKTVYLYDHAGDGSLPLHPGDVCLHGREQNILEKFPKFDPLLLKRVRGEISVFRPHIVQVNGARTIKYGAMAKSLSGSHMGWKLIYRNIGLPADWHHWWGTIVAYRFAIMSQMDGVIGVSRYSLENAQGLYRMRAPSTVILNGISTERMKASADRDAVRSKLGVRDGEVVLLFVGFMDDVKRPERFVNLIDALSETTPHVRGWMVGEGPASANVRALITALDLTERVRLLGSQDDVASIMQAADIFVMTSQTEGVPAVVLEAGYMGLPVVATRVGGLPECVEDGEGGILVDPESPRELMEATKKLVLDSSLRRRMGDRGRNWISGNLTIEHVADRYLAFYQRIRAGRTPQTAPS